MEVTDFDNLLWHLVRKFMNRDVSSHLNNNEDDLMSEVRIAAQLAIENFDATKKVKIETYIVTCVKNKLKNMLSYESTKPALAYEDYDACSEFSFEQTDFNLSMKSLLTGKEYQYYKLEFVEGYSLREIISLNIFKEREAKCLRHRILQKFVSSEKNLQKHLTQKKLQENWLSSFTS